MPRVQLYQLTCDRCGHTETSRDYGLRWGNFGAMLYVGGSDWPSNIAKETVGGGARKNVILCPECSEELWAWWRKASRPVLVQQK